MNAAPRIVCVSNRLPVTATEENGKLEFLPSSGGLVTALQPVLEMWQGVWAGWPGTLTSAKEAVEGALAEFSAQSDFQLLPVLLDQEAVTGFYQGFSNQIIWPLFHDLQSRCNFEPEFWEAYIRVQHSFRDELLKHIRETDLLWVHDYHLIGLGNVLRKEGFQGRIAFFLHTPFPGPDIFSKLPWRNEVLESLLSYDLVGFQTQHEVHNFLDCVEALTPYRYTRRRELFAVKVDKLECAVGGFPVSIDFNEFEGSARLPEVEAKAKTIRDDMNVEFLVLSMDRLDYTKGIPYRIKAFKRMLELEPNLKKRVALLQVVVPSRVEVPEYKQLRLEIEQLVSELNGTHGEPGWVPVHHLFRSLLREEVIAMYRASDVALV
ncbi:MAG: trehalose-6-phosphate synthase, partial [Proteobacteria bacterium]